MAAFTSRNVGMTGIVPCCSARPEGNSFSAVWRHALGRTVIWRYYAIIVTADRRDLNELLVSKGLARIYGTRTALPDGRDSREYLSHLHALENEAKAAKRGGWGKVNL